MNNLDNLGELSLQGVIATSLFKCSLHSFPILMKAVHHTIMNGRNLKCPLET